MKRIVLLLIVVLLLSAAPVTVAQTPDPTPTPAPESAPEIGVWNLSTTNLYNVAVWGTPDVPVEMLLEAQVDVAAELNASGKSAFVWICYKLPDQLLCARPILTTPIDPGEAS